MIDTPIKKSSGEACGLRRLNEANVDSTLGDVEAHPRRGAGWMLLAALVALQMAWSSGCVETAECNATVECPSDEVCYQFRCRTKCDSQDQCAADEQCAPCKPAGSSDEQGKCFGEDLSACVPETSS